MIKIRYIYSACVVTETPDVHILHDPWFTDGVYDGAWYQFPKLDDPMTCIGNVDLIYISHIHPDHYDPIFLRNYFETYGEKKIIIGDHKPNHLMNKMKADGFSPEVLDAPLTIGATSVTVLPHKTGSVSDIDTAIVIQFKTSARTHTVVNCNDVIMDQSFRDQIKATVGNNIDVCLLGYTGAGPYPQTYYEADDRVLKVKAEAKKQEFFARYAESIGDLQAKRNLPFAGQYLLGGRLAHMNPYRGVADACEVLPLDSNAVVLEEGEGWIDTDSLVPHAERTSPFDPDVLNERLEQISKNPLAYETDLSDQLVEKINLKQFLKAASIRARKYSEVQEDYFFCFDANKDETVVINASKNALEEDIFKVIDKDAALPTPRSEIIIDHRYLLGLLIRAYHWNNAEVGSLFATRRTPDTFNRSAQSYLNTFTVI